MVWRLIAAGALRSVVFMKVFRVFVRGRVTDTVSGLDQSEKQINKGAKELVEHFVKDTKKKR